MSASIFSNLIASKTNFLFYSAMKYSPKILHKAITKRKRSSFLFVLHGKYKYTFEDGSFIADDNTLIFLPLNGSYTYEVISDKTESMQIECDILCDGEPFSVSEKPITVKLEKVAMVIEIFEKLINLYIYKQSGNDFTVNYNLFKLFSILTRNEEKSIAINKSKIFAAVSYIDSNFTENIRVSYLAKLCIMSESQLRRIFLNELGMSPMQYKRKLQLDYAYTLLESGNYQITQIAELVGFNTIYEFSAAFKKENGISPRYYINSKL